MTEVDAERARNLAGSLPEHVVEMRDETHVSVPKGALENLARWALELDASREGREGRAMASEFANLVKGMQRRDTEVNVEQALAMAHAESNKAGGQHEPREEWYAWNRVIRALWDVQRLRERGAREERGRLSDKAREARRPLPPENLVGALQDTVHEDTGRTRAVHVGTREEPSDGA